MTQKNQQPVKQIEKQAWEALGNVPDPELGVSLVDLGLIYEIDVEGDHVEILMTLTTIGCPLFSMIEEDVLFAIRKIDGVKHVKINLTFDPPWGPEKMSDEAKEALGF